jgi:hypothetical protein
MLWKTWLGLHKGRSAALSNFEAPPNTAGSEASKTNKYATHLNTEVEEFEMKKKHQSSHRKSNKKPIGWAFPSERPPIGSIGWPGDHNGRSPENIFIPDLAFAVFFYYLQWQGRNIAKQDAPDW